MKGRIAIGFDEALYFAERIKMEILKHRQERHLRYRVDFCLISSCDTLIKLIEWLHRDETTERGFIERHFVELTRGDQRLYAAAIVGKRGAQATELIVDKFEHASQTAELATILLGNTDITFITRVVLDGRPHMLEGGTHLDFKAVLIELGHLIVRDKTLRYTADIMEGVIAEAIKLVEFALIYRFTPVDIEDMLHDSSHLVDIIGIEGDDAHSEYIGDIVERLIFGTFQLKFST